MLAEFRPILGKKGFSYLWISQILSQITINLTNFLLLIRLFNTTGSTIATSLLWISYALPAILIGPVGAAVTDMIDRRKMLIITNLLQSLVILIYALTFERTIFLTYGVAITYSLLNQFYVPAEAASLPALIEKKHLPSANVLFFMTQQGSIILGFLAAGILNHFFGFSTTLFIASTLLFFAFVSVNFLPKLLPSEKIPKSFEEGIFNFFGRIFEGYNFIKEERTVLIPFLLLLGFQIMMATILINVPIMIISILKMSVNTGIIYVVISAVCGAIVGSLIVGRLLRLRVRKKVVIENSLALLALAIFLLVFLVPELKTISRFLFGAGALFLAGFSAIGIIIPAQTFLQEKTPGGLRGRVFGNFWFLATIATVFPVLFSGAISELFGIRLLLFGISSLLVVAFWFSRKHSQKLMEAS